MPETYNVSDIDDDEVKHQIDISFGWSVFGLRAVKGESTHTGTLNGVTFTFRTDLIKLKVKEGGVPRAVQF